MQSKKDDAPPDERIGGPPRPRSRADLLVEEILDLQRRIRSLERELQKQSVEEDSGLVSSSKEIPSDYPG